MGAVVLCALTGCSVVDRTALRLNKDGSIDFGSCDSLGNVSAVTTYFSARDSEEIPVPLERAPASVTEGSVIGLGAPPSYLAWDYVSVHVEGRGDTDLLAFSDRDELVVGEWRWAQTGIFIGTVDVEGCDLDE
jgi:hypothetical protein